MISLSAAVRRNDLPAATEVLRAGGDVDGRDPEGFTPLMIAAGRGHVQMLELLLASGADVHALEPRMGASALHKAAQGGSVEAARLLLERGAFIDMQSATLGHTPLIDAVWYKNLEVARLLLSRGAKTSLRTHYGMTALDWAQRDQLIPFTELLEARDREDAERASKQQLMASVKKGDLSEVRRLLAEGAAVDERAPMAGTFDDGYTPLAVAARDGHAEIVRALLEARADPRQVDGLMKATPGHKAGYMGHTAAARALIEHLATNRASGRVLELDAQGPYNGFTALHDAVWHGHIETARVLLEAGARLDLRSHGGFTPRELAELYGYEELARLLRAREAASSPSPEAAP